MNDKLKDLSNKINASKEGGGERRIEAQHKKGKLTARERIEVLLDENSFEEIGGLVTHRSTNFMDKTKFLGDGVITDGIINKNSSMFTHKILPYLGAHN